MPSAPPSETYARQTILSEVGPEGQALWAKASIALFAEGAVLSAAQTALGTSGLGSLRVPAHGAPRPLADLTLVLTQDPILRRDLNREARAGATLFGWTAGEGHALLGLGASAACPCFECFETMNPKAFNGKGSTQALRLLGAAAATESLLWLLRGSSPLEGRVWLVSPGSGTSLTHIVRSSPKCPARLLSEGAQVTP